MAKLAGGGPHGILRVIGGDFHKASGVRYIASVVLVATAMLAGCGGSGQSDEQQIRSVVNRFSVEAGQGNSAACGLTTGELHSLCSGYLSHVASSTLAKLIGVTISKVVVSGSSATVAFNGLNEVVTLSKQNGSWLIATLG